MLKLIKKIKSSIISKLILSVGVIFLFSLSIWGYFNISYMKKRAMNNITCAADRLSNTIRLGTHYAMMLNSRNDIKQIIKNVARQNEIVNVRIYNKSGEIKFSNQDSEIDHKTNIEAEACFICHREDPPVVDATLDERIRIFKSDQGHRYVGVISPIYNEPGCATGGCHIHPEDKKVLGALDLVLSMEETDREIVLYERKMMGLSVFIFLITSTIIFSFLFRFVKYPIEKLIKGTRLIEKGKYTENVDVDQADELGELAKVVNRMGNSIGKKQTELNKQKDQYRRLFEMVPCIITVIDKNYRLLSYNHEFSEKFSPSYGDYCFQAYKGRMDKCPECPVDKTFKDGKSHYSEETGLNKDGTTRHWIVRTAPIQDDNGEIVAAIEMNLDITERKQLENKLEESEKKYYDIFNNIPNPVFVLDMQTLEIKNCNKSVQTVYEYSQEDLSGKSFLDFFKKEERESLRTRMMTATTINQVRQHNKNGDLLYVNIRISPSAYLGQTVLLVTISDVTKRLEAEQLLIQAGKMATLGEMATGVAHELNQPLSVIKTASSFFMRKVKKKEPIKEDILFTMSEEIDSHVERATKIINHMREFGRKTDPDLVPVDLNAVIEKAFEIFSQQLKVRGIEVVWHTADDLPAIMGDPGRLEQVLINLLINARDAIEERWEDVSSIEGIRTITLTTRVEKNVVMAEVCDTGKGIPKKIRSKIFEPFFTTKKVGKGTGLGLSISYGIIKECGGDILTRENEGGGTCFILQFPIPL